MKTIATIISFIFFAVTMAGNNPKERPPTKVVQSMETINVFTANGCGISNYLVFSKGNPATGALPLLGYFENRNQIEHVVFDTVAGNEIVGIIFPYKKFEPGFISYPEKILGIVTDFGVSLYEIENKTNYYLISITKKGFIPIVDVSLAENSRNNFGINKTVLAVKTNHPDTFEFKTYSGNDLEPYFDFRLKIIPEKMTVKGNTLFIAGKAGGFPSLFQVNIENKIVQKQLALNANISNFKEIIYEDGTVYLLSSPLGQQTVVTRVNLNNNTIFDTILDPGSGCRATSEITTEYISDRRNGFYFQPINNSGSNQVNLDIVQYNPRNSKIDTILYGKNIEYYFGFQDQGFGQFGGYKIGGSWLDGTNDTLFYTYYDKLDHVIVGAFPDFIVADYGCWIGVDILPEEKIRFEVYPNPTKNEVNVEISGLEHGENYELDLISQTGKVYSSTAFKVKENFKVPIGQLSPGIYFLRLKTGNTIVTRKIIKH